MMLLLALDRVRCSGAETLALKCLVYGQVNAEEVCLVWWWRGEFQDGQDYRIVACYYCYEEKMFGSAVVEVIVLSLHWSKRRKAR